MDGQDVKESSRSAITLVVLAVVFLAAIAWGWSRVTSPFPEKVEAAPCTDTLVAAGDEVAPPQVMVTVLNAGGANGLAGKTMDKAGRLRLRPGQDRQRAPGHRVGLRAGVVRRPGRPGRDPAGVVPRQGRRGRRPALGLPGRDDRGRQEVQGRHEGPGHGDRAERLLRLHASAEHRPEPLVVAVSRAGGPRPATGRGDRPR
ncbi:hypothetical protein [Nocardioides convexus]|uniref:hypothetical protein n=1 Tax=Nocardioides convexus TaxID=2712224 RepID=UPI0024185961|nr:hypothetical protein [Nocardioides convexus]